jgi:hypothetical protein
LTLYKVMKTSFALWLENRDPELFMLLEDEWDKRRNQGRPKRNALLAGTAAALAGAGLFSFFGGGGDSTPKKPDSRPQVVHTAPATTKHLQEDGDLKEYKGSDKEDIFRYATKQSFNGVNIFPYNVGGSQEGIIARVSLPDTPTAPLNDDDLQRQYKSFVAQVRHAMRTGSGGGVLTVRGVNGQGNVNWEYIAVGKRNPVRGEEGMREIVLYAKKPLGVK